MFPGSIHCRLWCSFFVKYKIKEKKTSLCILISLLLKVIQYKFSQITPLKTVKIGQNKKKKKKEKKERKKEEEEDSGCTQHAKQNIISIP